jgi:molybdate transport system ATP-binding protein
MIEVRIARRAPQGADSPGFSLEVDFKAAAGITVLFGPSGAGKTLTLESIAGFVRPDSGRILLDDAILFDAATRIHLPPRLRRFGYVFQNYALFPHMTLRDNLSFAAARWPRMERSRRVAELIEQFQLGTAAARRPHEASGGEKQRCSIARALVGEPSALLLDEPARGLDAPLRASLYELLRGVRARFNMPILLVTHDLDEAFALGDQMLVMQEGRLVQSGSPAQILDRPASADVARLLGIPNLFEATIAALDPGRNSSRLEVPGFALTAAYLPGRFRGDRVWVCFRAEDVVVHAASEARPLNAITAALARVSERPRGLRLEFAGGVVADVSRAQFERLRAVQEWALEIPSAAVRVL